jgi:perosamine synthetase
MSAGLSSAVAVAPQPLAAAVLAAVRGVLQASSGPVSLHEPEFRGREWEYVKECLDTGWVSSVGKFVDRFEADLAAYTGSAFAIATSNGTAALHVCLLLAGVRPGDEVMIPSLTFVATANAVSYAGATPHFVESEERTLGVDPACLGQYLREVAEVRGDTCFNRRSGAPIRALMPMHTFGHPVDLAALNALCAEWRLVLVEDAAESLGSYYGDRHTGRFGRVSGLSFNGNKLVTTGGGGAVLTDDPALGKLAKHLTTTARTAHRWSFVHDQVGFNYRMPNINAALGCAQLEQLPGFLERKRALAARYARAFAGVEGVSFVTEPPGTRSNYWLNAIKLDRPDIATRDAILTALNDAGFMARPAWMPMHRLPMYSNCPRASLDCTEALEASLVNLPSSPKLADA